jgi:endonuclease YncB( thermonuclease family)
MLSKLKIQNLLKENDTVYIVPYYANQANQIIAYIYKQGININEELLKSGYAKASNEDCTKNEILLANNAKENKLGLWKYSNYIKKK